MSKSIRLSKALVFVTAIAAVAAVFAAGVTSSAASTRATKSTALRGTYTVGSLAQLTGGTAWFGEVVRNARQLAVEDVNARGGVRGREYAVKFRDLQNDAVVSVAQFRQFMDVDHVPVVIEGSSLSVLATCPIAQASSKVIIVNDAASSPLVPKSCGTATFSVIPPSTAEMTTLARFLWKKQGLRKAAVFKVTTDVNVGIAGAFTTAWKALGGEIVADQSVEPNTADFRSQIAALRAAGPPVTLLAAEAQDAARFVQQANNLDFKPQYVSQSNAVGADVVKYTKEGGNTLIYSTVAFDPAGTTKLQQAFIARYTKRFGATPVMLYAALAYDSTRMVADAINANGYSAAAINRYLRGLKSYTGVSGVVRYPKPGDPRRLVQLIVLRNGTTTLLKPGHS